VADGDAGLLVLPMAGDVGAALRVEATPQSPFTIEAAPTLAAPVSWKPLLTTNVATMPFDFLDREFPRAAPSRFYRVRQP
jgi:hypothetical protein